MKTFLNLFKKDLRELISFQLILPLVIVVVMFSLIGNITQGQANQAAKPEPLLIVDYDNSALSSQFITELKSVSIPEVYESNGATPVDMHKTEAYPLSLNS